MNDFQERRHQEGRREMDRWKEATDKWKTDVSALVNDHRERLGKIEGDLETGRTMMTNLSDRMRLVDGKIDRNTAITVEHAELTKTIASKQEEIAQQTAGISQFLLDFDVISRWAKKIGRGFKQLGTIIIWTAAICAALGTIVYVWNHGLPQPPLQKEAPK